MSLHRDMIYGSVLFSQSCEAVQRHSRGGVMVTRSAWFDAFGGRLILRDDPVGGCVRWTYDGGAGGVHAGRWTDAGAVAEWLEANAAAL